jgi:peptidoglycan hydrolase-like amidase
MRPRYAVALAGTFALLVSMLAPQLLLNGADALTGTRSTAGPTPRVSVNQSYPVPGSGRYTVRGHGYGHGRGMSQWGAQGAALE